MASLRSSGIGPTSHRFGMFIDNMLAAEFVDWDGNVERCSREENSDDFYSLLAGLGRHGVITEVTLRLMKINRARGRSGRTTRATTAR